MEDCAVENYEVVIQVPADVDSLLLWITIQETFSADVSNVMKEYFAAQTWALNMKHQRVLKAQKLCILKNDSDSNS
ncbi:MAG: hypothetical protein WC384_16335 [Prolixibacteraceae bacterium]